MADTFTPRARSALMARVRTADTAPEIVLRKGLHRLGLRFRLHAKGYPGTPDLVLPRFKAAVFVHGCFWHRHQACKFSTTPKTNTDFWLAKFEKNIRRDALVAEELTKLGWRVFVVWGCELSTISKAWDTATKLAESIRHGAG